MRKVFKGNLPKNILQIFDVIYSLCDILVWHLSHTVTKQGMGIGALRKLKSA